MGETILITGASSGIGKVTAKYFHDKGWNVVATMRTPENDTELGELDNVLVTRLDVTDAASIDVRRERQGIERFGKPSTHFSTTRATARMVRMELFSMEKHRSASSTPMSSDCWP